MNLGGLLEMVITRGSRAAHLAVHYRCDPIALLRLTIHLQDTLHGNRYGIRCFMCFESLPSSCCLHTRSDLWWWLTASSRSSRQLGVCGCQLSFTDHHVLLVSYTGACAPRHARLDIRTVCDLTVCSRSDHLTLDSLRC